MHLHLLRDTFCDTHTLGKLTINGQFECYTLEDTDRYLDGGGIKIYGQTAIPAGVYTVTLSHSPRFGRVLPLLLSVPGFSGVRIHPGNSDRDTEGCILVGDARNVEDGASLPLSQSRKAFERLMEKLKQALAKSESIRITIEREK